jgi:hypothetical protein
MNVSKNVKFQDKFYENVAFEEQSNSVTADEVRARRDWHIKVKLIDCHKHVIYLITELL